MLKVRAIRHQISIEIEGDKGEQIAIAQAREYATEVMANRVMEFNVGWKEIDAELNYNGTRATIRFER